jgi:hypothetical protein
MPINRKSRHQTSPQCPHATLHLMLPHERDLPDEPPPFLGAWPRVYAAVVLYLALVIAACYCFTRFFA